MSRISSNFPNNYIIWPCISGARAGGRYGDLLRAGWFGVRIPVDRDFPRPSRHVLGTTQPPGPLSRE